MRARRKCIVTNDEALTETDDSGLEPLRKPRLAPCRTVMHCTLRSRRQKYKEASTIADGPDVQPEKALATIELRWSIRSARRQSLNAHSATI